MYSMQCLAEISITIYYLNTKAAAVHKTPAQIISEMVQERIAATA
jgi:hypothetical protein